MSGRITINLNVLSLDRRFGFDAYVDKLVEIEAAGIDGIVMPDHVVFGSNVTYPWGGWQIDSSDTWPEPLAVLAAGAGATRRVALITNVLIAPLRSVPLLAKQVATLHGLARGRLELGVGAGWQREEYEASGLEFETRSAVLFEQMCACRELWRSGPASYHGQHVHFDDIWCAPGIADATGPRGLPLWFGVAPTAANVRLFMEFAHAGWSCIEPDPVAISRGRGQLERLLAERGVSRAGLRVRAAPKLAFDGNGHLDIAATLAAIPEGVRAGVTEFDVPLLFVAPGERAFRELLERLAAVERAVDRYV
jgi:alkanesulfonate monooxygenase SsuD/methylene tetrahydromethanopterin reductase-like flavin-dependent oxidoreductase (luciferase family)